jgi:hypothetical protein
MRTTIGTCSNCGGPITIPTVWHGTVPPIKICENCGAIALEDHGPVMPVKTTTSNSMKITVTNNTTTNS